MMTVWLAVGVAVLAFASGVAGLYLQKLLPEPHSVDRSRDMIGAIVGLVSLLLALVLGTLVGSSYAFFSTQKSELETFAARSVQLDLALAEFGPETAPARARMKATLQGVREMIWGEGAQKNPVDFSIAEPLPHLRESGRICRLSRSEDAGPAAIRGSGGRRRGRDRADPVADLAAIGLNHSSATSDSQN